MEVAGEVTQPRDCFLLDLDIENYPSAEIPLTELYDILTSSLRDDYREIIHLTIIQMLEDTMWIDLNMMEVLSKATFGIFEVRANRQILSLRTPGLQRLVTSTIATRTVPITALQITLLIRFKMSEIDLPRPPRPTENVMRSPAESSRSAVRSGPPSNVSEAELLDQVSELPGSSPILQMRGSFTAPVSTGNIESIEHTNTTRGTQSVLQRTDVGSTLLRGDRPSSVPGTGPEARGGADAPIPGMRATFRGNPVDVDPRGPSIPRP
jgi:hypothetical protein